MKKKEDSEVPEQAYVVIERFEKNKEPFYKLRASKYQFITLFGKESEIHFNDIVKLTNRIMTVSGFLGRRFWKDQGRRKFTDEQFEKHLEKMDEYEAIIWEDYGENGDEIKEPLKQTINGIEKICNSILREK